MEQVTATIEIKRRRGRRPIDEAKKLVLVAGKVPPDVKTRLEDIMCSRNWTMSEAIRAACEALVKSERRKQGGKIAIG